MNDIIEKLRVIKYKSEEDIEKTIENVVSEFSESQKLEEKIVHFLRQNAIECKEKGEFLVFIILLSFVLSDIACQMSPDLKDNNLRKIKSICEKRKINFRLITSLTSYETILTKFINESCSNQYC